MPDRPRPSLEDRLADLAPAIAFPATPPLAALVGARLRQPPGRVAFGRPLRRGLAFAIAAMLLLVGVAAAVGIALGGLRLVFGPASFSPQPSLSAGPGLGERVSLAEARAGVTFTLRLPALPGLAEPDLVYLAEPPQGGAVTLLYGARPGFPADPESGVSLILTQFRADIGPEVFEKLIDAGVTVTASRVHGLPAWWVAGGDHFFFYRDETGRMVDTTLRLAGDTLIWEEAGVTHRVEGAPTLADALRVAESIEQA
jgi:hypothetical protein